MACCHPVSNCRIDYDHNTRSRLSQLRLSPVIYPVHQRRPDKAWGDPILLFVNCIIFEKKGIYGSMTGLPTTVTRRSGGRRLNIDKRSRHPRRPGDGSARVCRAVSGEQPFRILFRTPPRVFAVSLPQSISTFCHLLLLVRRQNCMNFGPYLSLQQDRLRGQLATLRRKILQADTVVHITGVKRTQRFPIFLRTLPQRFEFGPGSRHDVLDRLLLRVVKIKILGDSAHGGRATEVRTGTVHLRPAFVMSTDAVIRFLCGK